MIPEATWLRGLTGNEIRRRGNISKPQLPLISSPLGRLQLRPRPGIRQNSRWGRDMGKTSPECEKAAPSVSPINTKTGGPQTFSCLHPAHTHTHTHTPRNFSLEPLPCAKTGERRRGVRGGVKTGSSFLNWTCPELLRLERQAVRGSPIPPLWWNSDSIPLSISARRPVSASQPGLATP